MKESKSMPELTTFTFKKTKDDDNDSINDSVSSGDILDISDMDEATEVVLPKVHEKGILSFLFGV